MPNSHLKYHKSLYKVAAKLQTEEIFLNELNALSELFKHKKFILLIRKISILPEINLKKLLELTFKDKISELLLNFLKILVQDKNLFHLPKIYESYKHYYCEEKGINEIIISAARVLTLDDQIKIKQTLQQKRKEKISLIFKQNQELLGGIQIYEKGYLQDFSIKNRLETLKKHLTNLLCN